MELIFTCNNYIYISITVKGRRKEIIGEKEGKWPGNGALTTMILLQLGDRPNEQNFHPVPKSVMGL